MATVNPAPTLPAPFPTPLAVGVSVQPARRRMTAEEFLALPDDGVDRDLIRGELREWGMTVRNRLHSRSGSLIVGVLDRWWREVMGGRGEVHSGEVGCYLWDGGTLVGIDAAWFDQETIDRQTDKTTMIVGPPVLAVEVLSPNDTVEKVHAKTEEYLAGGVKQVWVVNPYVRAVFVHRPGQPFVAFNESQELIGDPELPGFKAAVRAFFQYEP